MIRNSRFCLSLLSAALLSACGQTPTTWPGGVPPEQQNAYGEPVVTAPVVAVESVRTDSELLNRIASLEADIAGLQAEMTAARPQIEKIDTLEGNFRQLSLQMDRISKTYPAAKPPTPIIAKPAAKKAPAPAAKPAAKKAVANGPAQIKGVRLGEQGNGRTRIVLDATAPAKIKYDIDNTEKILVVELPSASWAGSTAQTLKSSPLVASYTAENAGAGSRLIVQLKSEAEVVSSGQVDPDKSGGYRSYLDLRRK